MTSMLF